MKAVLTILLSVIALNCFSQDVEVRSEELNKIIWNKINDRLVMLGKNPIDTYEHTEMKDFSTRVCERLIPENAPFKHSNNDSISKYSGGECIYTYELTASHNNRYIDYLKSGNLDKISQNIIDGWVESDSHRRAISQDWYDSTTVSTIIIYNEKTGYFKIAAAWHEKDSFSSSMN